MERLKTFLDAKSNVSTPLEDNVHLIKSSVNRVSAFLQTSRPGVLILNEWFTLAWQARVNGKIKATVRANQWQVGVPVPMGRNVVEFTYRPSTSWKLLILNRVTWVMLTLFVLFGLYRRFRMRWRNLPGLV
jgi:uncharacterized membrane protein YfhO